MTNDAKLESQRRECACTYRLARAFIIPANAACLSCALIHVVFRCGLEIYFGAMPRRNENKEKKVKQRIKQCSRKQSRVQTLLSPPIKTNESHATTTILSLLQYTPALALIPTLVANNSAKRAAKLWVSPCLSAS